MEKSNLDRIKDVLFTNDLGSEEKYEGEMSLYKPAQEEGTNWLGFNFTPSAQVHDYEMSLENLTRIRNYETIYQECKAALETPSPAPSIQQDSQSEKYSINATHFASCLPQDVANATPIPAIPLVEEGNATAVANNAEMDATPPNLLLKQDSMTLTTTGCAISATLPPPCRQEDLAKAKSCAGDDATSTPTLANSQMVKRGNPSGIAINTEIDATPPNPLLQQDSAITNPVLDVAPLSVSYHGTNKSIAMNSGEDGMVVKQGIKKANVQAHGAREKNGIKLPAPWLDNYTVKNKPRASSKIIDTYYHHNTLNFKCRSRVEVALYELHGITPNHARDESNLEFLANAANFIKEFEKQNSEKKSSSTKRKRKKTACENLEGTNSAPTMNMDEKNSTVLEGGNEEEGMEAKVNLKEEGDIKKQQEVEGSQGGIMASQTPNSESAFKFDDSGLIDVPVLYCAEEFKNLLWSNQGATTSAASQHETVIPGYNEHIGNDCQTSCESSELDELRATKLALETMEAQFNATQQALTIMEAKLDSMIEIERQNRELLQALNNGTESPTPSE